MFYTFGNMIFIIILNTLVHENMYVILNLVDLIWNMMLNL